MKEEVRKGPCGWKVRASEPGSELGLRPAGAEGAGRLKGGGMRCVPIVDVGVGLEECLGGDADSQPHHPCPSPLLSPGQ